MTVNGRLITKLKRAVEAIPNSSEMETRQILIDAWLNGKPGTDPEALQALVAALNQESALGQFDNNMQWFMGVGVPLGYMNLAKWLIFRALQVGARQALENAFMYAEQPEFECQVISAVGGIQLEENCQLAGKVSLEPFANIHNSPSKIQIDKRFSYVASSRGPSAAILQQPFTHPKIHLEAGVQGVRSLTTDVLEKLEGLQSLVRQRISEADDARLCLTLIGPSGPVVYCSWTEPADWVPSSISGYSIYITRVAEEGHDRRKLKKDEYQAAHKIHNLFLSLSETDRKRLRIPLSRLNSAIRRHPSVDSAIDLGIAMETLFLSDTGNQGELSYRLSLRAGRVLGVSGKERKTIADKFKKLYKMRSRAVHSGELQRTVGGGIKR